MLVKLVTWTIRDKKIEEGSQESEGFSVSIDERFLERPAFAMEICRQTTRKMAEKTKETILLSLEVLANYSDEGFSKVCDMEDMIDKYEDALGTYLIKLSGKNLNRKDSQSLSIMLHSISDFERISDHAINIVESAKEINELGDVFSESAKEEIRIICEAVAEVVERTTKAFCEEDMEGAVHIEPLEEVIDHLTKKIKQHHVKRLQAGQCTIETGIILEDVLTNLERVSDHCSNIAVEMLAINNDAFDTHVYFDAMPERDRDNFKKEYLTFKNKYKLDKTSATI